LAYVEALHQATTTAVTDDYGKLATPISDIEIICAKLGIGMSTVHEYAANMTMYNTNDFEKKELNGTPMLPRIINVQNKHCCIALDYTKLSHKMYTMRELADAFEGVSKGKGPMTYATNKASVKAHKAVRAAYRMVDKSNTALANVRTLTQSQHHEIGYKFRTSMIDLKACKYLPTTSTSDIHMSHWVVTT
jgi:hypothetical protein